MLNTDIRHDYVGTVHYRGRELSREELNEEFERLEQTAFRELGSEGMSQDLIDTNRSTDVRYKGQEHTLTVPLGPGPISDQSLSDLRNLFDATHQRRYGHSSPEEPVELVNIRLRAMGRLTKPGLFELRETANGTQSVEEPQPRRVAHLGGEQVEVPVVERYQLRAGTEMTGPAIIIEDGCTTILPERYSLTVDEHGNMVIDVPEEVF
jgi:N-methylhydantoinase A